MNVKVGWFGHHILHESLCSSMHLNYIQYCLLDMHIPGEWDAAGPILSAPNLYSSKPKSLVIVRPKPGCVIHSSALKD